MEQNRISFHDQISSNKLKSFFLIIVVLLVLLALGFVIGQAMGPDYFTTIMIFAVIISIFYIWIGYYFSDRIALASVNAKPADENEYRNFHNIVEGLCLASGMPKPRLYIMKDNNINAFATGRDPKHAVICVTTGTLDKLNKQELEGVLGHELSHIANFDIRFMTLTAVLVGMIAIISQIFLRSLWFRGDNDNDNKGNAIFMVVGIILAILAPIVVQLVQLAISRKREYVADASAVKFIRSPTGLINALKKIKSDHSPPDNKINKAVAPLFISDPFKKNLDNLMSTHPPLEKRIEILERM
ncbi:MAG: M48 family metallopeptidase [Candidatus Nanoarchaeia archaeon]|nr:M48 family metallopeptidase [Candidatus Nanoarchaeia archaeon]